MLQRGGASIQEGPPLVLLQVSTQYAHGVVCQFVPLPFLPFMS
jgi:hypothetical protein